MPNLILIVDDGVAQLFKNEDGAGLLARADSAPYRAKRGGRNRVEAAHPPLIRAQGGLIAASGA